MEDKKTCHDWHHHHYGRKALERVLGFSELHAQKAQIYLHRALEKVVLVEVSLLCL